MRTPVGKDTEMMLHEDQIEIVLADEVGMCPRDATEELPVIVPSEALKRKAPWFSVMELVLRTIRATDPVRADTVPELLPGTSVHAHKACSIPTELGSIIKHRVKPPSLRRRRAYE